MWFKIKTTTRNGWPLGGIRINEKSIHSQQFTLSFGIECIVIQI